MPFYDPPDLEYCRRNAAFEPEGERLRNELTAWLKANRIVTLRLSTAEGLTVEVESEKLPPTMKIVLTRYGSIYVATDRYEEPPPAGSTLPMQVEASIVHMTEDVLERLDEYSRSLPTGTTEGKRWRRHIGADWWMGEYGPSTGGQVPIIWRRIIFSEATDALL